MRAHLIVVGALIAVLVAPFAVAIADTCSDGCEKKYASCSKSCKANDTDCFTQCINEKESCIATCR